MGPEEFFDLVRAFQGEAVTFRSQAAQIPPRDHEGRPLASPELVEVAHPEDPTIRRVSHVMWTGPVRSCCSTVRTSWVTG